MPSRRLSLGVRILLSVLIVVGPPPAVLWVVRTLFPAAPDGVPQGLVVVAFAWICISLFIAPAALLASPKPPEDRSEPDGDGGGGGGEPRPPRGLPPDPGGGIPLPDATQSDTRLRDHDRGRRQPRRARRAVRNRSLASARASA